MKYKITITKIEEVTSTEKGDWREVSSKPWTNEELSDKARGYNEEDFLKDNPLNKKWGYTPDREVTKSEETQILAQTVDELDVAAVIKAVNGI